MKRTLYVVRPPILPEARPDEMLALSGNSIHHQTKPRALP